MCIYIYTYVNVYLVGQNGIYIYKLKLQHPPGRAPNKNNGYTGYLEGSTEQGLLVNMQTPRPPPGYIVVYWVNIEIKF
jgi:hypothetical protein